MKIYVVGTHCEYGGSNSLATVDYSLVEKEVEKLKKELFDENEEIFEIKIGNITLYSEYEDGEEGIFVEEW